MRSGTGRATMRIGNDSTSRYAELLADVGTLSGNVAPSRSSYWSGRKLVSMRKLDRLWFVRLEVGQREVTGRQSGQRHRESHLAQGFQLQVRDADNGCRRRFFSDEDAALQFQLHAARGQTRGPRG